MIAFVVYLLMQEHFVDKMHFFMFLSMSDKTWLGQLKLSQYCFSWYKFLIERFSSIGTRKGKHPMLRTNAKPQQLIKHTKISNSIASLVFRKFSCVAYLKPEAL